MSVEECPDCGLDPHQPGNPSGTRTCTVCGKGIWFDSMVIGTPNMNLVERIKELESRLQACLEGQDALKEQTVRIREALTDELREGVDTEQIAKELRARLASQRESINSQTEEILRKSYRLSSALGFVHEIASESCYSGHGINPCGSCKTCRARTLLTGSPDYAKPETDVEKLNPIGEPK